MRVQRRVRALGAALVAAVLVLGGCGGGAGADPIPADWTRTTEFFAPSQTAWTVGDGESTVWVERKVEDLSVGMKTPLDTEDQWIAALTEVVTNTTYSGDGPQGTPVDVSFDGAAMSFEYLKANGDLESLGVFIYDHETDSLWLAATIPQKGDIDPRFLDDFVRNFSPELIAEASV